MSRSPAVRLRVLLGQRLARRSRIAGEEQQQVLLEVVEGRLVDRERVDGDAVVLVEFEARETADAAMYWSCLPTGSPSTSISMCAASSASAPAVMCSRFIA